MQIRCFLLNEIDNVLYIYLCGFWEQEKELVQLKREARLKGGFYVSPEAKLLFVIRIRG
jgi:large subunit ribosomal protein L7e